MQINTNLAAQFIQLADQRGNRDGGANDQELAALTIGFYDDYTEAVAQNNTQLADQLRPFIQLGVTPFFGGQQGQGLVFDFDGDGRLSSQDAIALDRNRDGTINNADMVATFGAAAGAGNVVTDAQFETLRARAAGSQFAADIGARPVADTPAPTPGMPNFDFNSPQGQRAMVAMLMTTMMMMMMMGNGMAGILPAANAFNNPNPSTPGNTMPGNTTPGNTGAPSQDIQSIQQNIAALCSVLAALGNDPNSTTVQSIHARIASLQNLLNGGQQPVDNPASSSLSKQITQTANSEYA